MLVHPALNLLGAGQVVLAFPLHPQRRQLIGFWQGPIGQQSVNTAFSLNPLKQTPPRQIPRADPIRFGGWGAGHGAQINQKEPLNLTMARMAQSD